jgi:DNA polymerase/3'-5' exonuclease PolX
MVSNADVVRTLERIAELLEIRGENTFKVRCPAVLFRIDDGARVAGETEEDVHAALGPPLIPPQRREDPAEIDTRATIPVATEV